MKKYFEAAPDLESSTDDYASRFDGAIGQWFLDVQMRGTRQHLRGVDSGKIVDVGGGHGQTLGGLLEDGHEVVVTGSGASCAHRLKAWLDNERASFEICPLTELPYPNDAFDAAISYRMMTHLEDWRGLVKELSRVARRRVIVDYPTFRSFNCLNDLLFRWKKGVERNTRRYNVFHEADVIAAFRESGFALRGRHGQFVLPMALHRAHGMRPLAALVEGCCRVFGLSYLFGSPVIACFEKEELR